MEKNLQAYIKSKVYKIKWHGSLHVSIFVFFLGMDGLYKLSSVAWYPVRIGRVTKFQLN